MSFADLMFCLLIVASAASAYVLVGRRVRKDSWAAIGAWLVLTFGSFAALIWILGKVKP
jgi:hypothetical protein